MGINFQGVLNFVDFVGSLHPQKTLAQAACKTMHAVATSHENTLKIVLPFQTTKI